MQQTAKRGLTWFSIIIFVLFLFILASGFMAVNFVFAESTIKTEFRFTKALQRGSRGDDVKQLQEFLKQSPDIYPEGLVTGYFGPLTEAAVKRFQEKNGIETVGMVGPKTRAKLNEFSFTNKSETKPEAQIKPEEKKEVTPTLPTPTPAPNATPNPTRIKNEHTQEMLDWAKERKIFFIGVNNNLLIPSSQFATDIIPMIEVPNTQNFLPSLQKLPDHLIRLLENNTIVVSTKFTWEKCKTHGLNDGFFLCQYPGGYFVHEIGHRVDFYGIKTLALGKTDAENKTILEEYNRIFSIPKDLYAKPSIFPGLPAGFLTSYSKSNIFENFADHFARYVESPELFRERAIKDPDLAEKYNFLKTKIFLGKEY